MSTTESTPISLEGGGTGMTQSEREELARILSTMPSSFVKKNNVAAFTIAVQSINIRRLSRAVEELGDGSRIRLLELNTSKPKTWTDAVMERARSMVR